MSNTQVVRKIIEKLAREVQDWNVKSSNMHPSDADWYIGFKKDAKENDERGDHVTYLNHWDADNTDYLENKHVKRDNGIGYQMNAMDQITPIK
jgi:hypothetical protein